jgi:hypothetical protein
VTTKKTSNHLLSRRETLRLMGAAGASALVGFGDQQRPGLWLPGNSGSISAGAQNSLLPGALRASLFAPSPLPLVKKD